MPAIELQKIVAELLMCPMPETSVLCAQSCPCHVCAQLGLFGLAPAAALLLSGQQLSWMLDTASLSQAQDEGSPA